MMDLLRLMRLRLGGTLGMIPGAAFATGEVTAAQLANIPCNVTREGEERRIPGSTGVASRKVRCEYTGSAWAWGEVGAAAIGSTTFSDDTFTVCDDADPTKCFKLQLSSIGAGATRTWTVPNGSSTFASTTLTQTLTNKTLTTPTIGDLTNATHSHQNNAGGGVLAAPGITSFANATHNHTDAAGGGVLGPAALGVIEMRLSSDYTASNSNSAQKVFNASTNGAATLAASTAYEMKGLYRIKTTGTTSHALGIGFAGTATLTSIGYMVATPVTPPATDIVAATNSRWTATASNTAISNAVATASFHVVHIEGTVRVNGTGTFIPQFTWSAAPGGTTTVEANSFITFTPRGTNTMTTIGTWS